MSVLRAWVLCVAATSLMGGGARSRESSSRVAEVAYDRGAIDRPLDGPLPPGITTAEQCDNAVALAERKGHDCAWAGALLQAERELRGSCNLTQQTTELRQARLIYTECQSSDRDVFQYPRFGRDPSSPFGPP